MIKSPNFKRPVEDYGKITKEVFKQCLSGYRDSNTADPKPRHYGRNFVADIIQENNDGKSPNQEF